VCRLAFTLLSFHFMGVHVSYQTRKISGRPRALDYQLIGMTASTRRASRAVVSILKIGFAVYALRTMAKPRSPIHKPPKNPVPSFDSFIIVKGMESTEVASPKHDCSRTPLRNPPARTPRQPRVTVFGMAESHNPP